MMNVKVDSEVEEEEAVVEAEEVVEIEDLIEKEITESPTEEEEVSVLINRMLKMNNKDRD